MRALGLNLVQFVQTFVPENCQVVELLGEFIRVIF